MKFIANERARQLKENFGMENAGVYDPQSIGGTHVIYVLHDATDPERYGGLPKNPTIPWSYTIWKWLFQASSGHVRAVWRVGSAAALYRGGSRAGRSRSRRRRRPCMATAIDRFDEKARRTFDSIGRTEVHRGELLRHPVYTRLLHWAVALFFFLALFTGFGIYLPWLFRCSLPSLAGDR